MNLTHSILRGGIGFAVVSVAAFAVWAFGDRAFTRLGGEAGLYAACTVVFVALSGLLLHRLVAGPGSLGRFYRIFIPAFVAYAVAWCAGWFALGMGAGEWLGSAAGSAVFAGVVAWSLGNARAWPLGALVLFIAHSAGYFLGGEMYYPSDRQVMAKLLWGLVYGLGFGAGIGFVFWLAQRKAADS